MQPEAAGRLQIAVLGAGDTIFVPCNWYHATLNLSPYVVAVGGQHEHTRPTADDDGTGAGAKGPGRVGGRCAADVFGAASVRRPLPFRRTF
jgi:hypothetical protein